MAANAGSRLRLFWIACGTLWLGGVVTGLAFLAGYDNRPGTAASSQARWPADSRITLDSTRPTLVMLAHPRCTCTRASVAELAELMARAQEQPRAYVVFLKPGGFPGEWERTDLWRSASRIPGVTVLRDDEGVEARRFGAETSGSTFLYDPSGRLLFSGGTTGSRGHTGDNAGRATLLALLNHEEAHRTGTPVFGCPLFSPQDAIHAEDSSDHGAHAHAQPN